MNVPEVVSVESTLYSLVFNQDRVFNLSWKTLTASKMLVKNFIQSLNPESSIGLFSIHINLVISVNMTLIVCAAEIMYVCVLRILSSSIFFKDLTETEEAQKSKGSNKRKQSNSIMKFIKTIYLQAY